MRIIRIAVLLLVLQMALAPYATLAAEDQKTNETKTNATIQENNLLLAYNKPDITHFFAYASVKPARSKEGDEREQVMAKWKIKQVGLWNKLPQGKFTINASAYTASADECGNDKGITASGLKVMENRTLACPPQFPFGTKINIDGQGTFVCEDRGGAIKGNHFDIYMKTKGEAFAFGRRNLTAEVVLD